MITQTAIALAALGVQGNRGDDVSYKTTCCVHIVLGVGGMIAGLYAGLFLYTLGSAAFALSGYLMMREKDHW